LLHQKPKLGHTKLSTEPYLVAHKLDIADLDLSGLGFSVGLHVNNFDAYITYSTREEPKYQTNIRTEVAFNIT